jgi:IclR family acetate operon transcriptional repressor
VSGETTPSARPKPGPGMPAVQSVQRAVCILRALFYSPDGETLGGLSKRVGLNKTTALRLLQTLQAEGMVHKDARTGLYRFEPAVWLRGASVMLGVFTTTSLTQRVLDTLAAATNATAAVVVPDDTGRQAVVTMQGLPDAYLRIEALGRRTALHATAAGKCYLAGLPSAELSRWLEGGLAGATKQTLTDPQKLIAELARVRKLGYATSRAEAGEGVCSLSVPLRDDAGRMIGGLSVARPGRGPTADDIRRWLPGLRAAAVQLSYIMYGHPDREERRHHRNSSNR